MIPSPSPVVVTVLASSLVVVITMVGITEEGTVIVGTTVQVPLVLIPAPTPFTACTVIR